MARKPKKPSAGRTALRAFITYAHEGEAFDQRVLSLANDLRRDGIDARLDRYESHPPQGWPRWMEEELAKAQKTIVVPSEKYLARYNQDSGVGSGARFETSILRSRLMKNGVSFDKLAVALVTPADEIYIPDLLHGCQRYDLSTTQGYELLYRWLTDQPTLARPKLGAVKKLSKNLALDTELVNNFRALCKTLKPLLDDNFRVFRDFGPNSGADSKGPVRYSLASWYALRKSQILPNNKRIRELIVQHRNLIPADHTEIFDRFISHIDAFETHVADEKVDYREHQFPSEITALINANAK